MESMQPKVTIIMTSYNYARYIGEAIKSILNQTYDNWELIIVDDGSTDESLMVIEEYKNNKPEKISLLIHPENKNCGIKETLELGLSQVRGDYIAFLESDDAWQPDYLAKKLMVFEGGNEISLVYSDLEPLASQIPNKYKDYIEYSRYIGFLSGGKPFTPNKYLWLRNPVVSFSNIMIRASLLKFIELKKEFEIWSDWRVIMTAALTGKFYYVPKKLLKWRIHQESANSNFMSQNNQYLSGSMFKIDMLKFVSEYCQRTGNSELMLDTLSQTLSIRAHFFRILHDFGFALYAPVSALRQALNLIKN
ncbi:MAG: glycosyltransferase [Ignavibacteria bacterium]|nr:glycosyltransferase [Ignavibacteria bacterium]